MEKVIPILPCRNATTQIEFYKHIGFEVVGKYARSYFVLKFKEIELHFYGTNKILPEENSSMSVILTDDLEQLYEVFIGGLKKHSGKVPRNGFPKISKIRDLSEDRRFTLTDPSGNTFYIINREKSKDGTFFRDISNEQYAERYAILYDLVYSKEDYNAANNLLPRLLEIKDQFDDLDKAKLLLTALEIQIGLGQDQDSTEIKSLILENNSNSDWTRIKEKFNEIFSS